MMDWPCLPLVVLAFTAGLFLLGVPDTAGRFGDGLPVFAGVDFDGVAASGRAGAAWGCFSVSPLTITLLLTSVIS